MGPPRISLPQFEVPIIIRERALHGHLTSQFWPLEDVVTDAVLHLTETTEIIMEEVLPELYLINARKLLTSFII